MLNSIKRPKYVHFIATFLMMSPVLMSRLQILDPKNERGKRKKRGNIKKKNDSAKSFTATRAEGKSADVARSKWRGGHDHDESEGSYLRLFNDISYQYR